MDYLYFSGCKSGSGGDMMFGAVPCYGEIAATCICIMYGDRSRGVREETNTGNAECRKRDRADTISRIGSVRSLEVWFITYDCCKSVR